MQMSHSRISTFKQCPYRFKLKYVDGLKTLPSDDPHDALYLGTAVHTAIEKGIDEAVEGYFNNFNICGESHFLQEYVIRQTMKDVILPDGEFEVKIDHPDFQGYIDLLVPVGEGEYDMYDFKYSNNIDHYMESAQLHLYKYFYELTTGNKIRSMFFLFIEKVSARPKKGESFHETMKRLQAATEKVDGRLEFIDYNPNKVIDYLIDVKHVVEATDYPKVETHLCRWCEYNKFCQKGEDYMILPSIENVPVNMEQYKKIWVYGEPFSGKTHLASEAPAPVLELNTDGNVKHYTMPRLTIKDSVVSTGRSTTKKFGWETFVEAINELEAGSEFKTIVVDLLDDVYDSCRAYMCDKKGWEHESDDSFKAYDIVRNEFLRTMKRLLNLQYNVILISHEDKSKDITRRSGDKVTQIKPNIPEKVAIKLAGMVDLVIRTEKDHDEYIISTKTNNVIFGGGRLGITKAVEVENSWDSIDELYSMNKSSKGEIEPVKQENTDSEAVSEGEPTSEETVDDKPFENDVNQVEDKPKTRTRRQRG